MESNATNVYLETDLDELIEKGGSHKYMTQAKQRTSAFPDEYFKKELTDEL